MKKISFFLIVSLISQIAMSQGKNKPQEIVDVIRLDKNLLSGVGLKKVVAPWDTARDLKQKRLYDGTDMRAYVVASQTKKVRQDNYRVEEVILLLSGMARLTPDGGELNTFYTGDFFFVPRGYNGYWETVGGQNHYLYEFSVIVKQKNEKDTNPAMLNPVLVDKEKLSGINLANAGPDGYYDIIHEGADLSIYLKGETEREIEINDHDKEQIIYVIAGMVTVTADGGEAQTFYPGDIFVMPEGFTGQWNAKGNNLFRTLILQKSSEK